MIRIKNNTCPICRVNELEWNLEYSKTQMEMFKCGHGTCKECYRQIQKLNLKQCKPFSCPQCKIVYMREKNIRFAEWYNEHEIFIKTGSANNMLLNTDFGNQLIRIMKESRKAVK